MLSQPYRTYCTVATSSRITSKTSGPYFPKNGHCFRISSSKEERLVIVPAVREIRAAIESCMRIWLLLNAKPANCEGAFEALHCFNAASTTVYNFFPVWTSWTLWGGLRFIRRGTEPAHLLQQ